MRIAFLGYGNVGAAVASAVAAAGHDVVLATNPERPEGAATAAAAHPVLAGATVADPVTAVTGADLVVLAVPFAALESVLAPLVDHLAGTVVVDATNPVGPGLTHGLGSQQAGAQKVAELLPASHVVKAFSIYGFENLAAAAHGSARQRPVMLFAGDDATAKAQVAELLDGLGWDPIDAGGLAAALDLEHLTLLWIRLVRLQGRDPHLVWAVLASTDSAQVA